MKNFFTSSLLFQYSLILSLFFVSFPLEAQENARTHHENRPAQIEERIDSTQKVKNYSQLERSEFNKGLITDPLQLIQAKFPSLLIARGGNDPNGQFDLRIRGVNSFENTRPLMLIDGLPVLSLDAIHPNDIGSVEVYKDGAAMAKYGIRGSNGVIDIKTRLGRREGTRIQYQGYMATENVARSPDLMTAVMFRSRGGVNLGGDTDWYKEITQNAASHIHHISLSGGSETFNYYGAINYDDVKGVVRNTGFERINSRLSFEQRALNNKLIIRGNLGHTQRESDFIPPVALEQAIAYNPTSPIYGEGEEFERFGGYYERVVYNNYNPVALIEQIEVNNIYQQVNVNLEGELELVKGLSLNGYYGQLRESWKTNFYAPSTSLLFDYYNGYANSEQFYRDNRYFGSSLKLEQKWRDFDFIASLDYHYQFFDETSLGIGGGDFITDVFSYHNLGAANAFPNGFGDISSSKSVHKISGYGGSVDISFRDRYFFSAAVIREGSSRLGENKQWGLFYGIDGRAKINDWLQLRANYSKTGNLPDQGSLSQGLYVTSGNFYYNGDFEEFVTKNQIENPDLQWEETRQWGIGANFQVNLFNKQLDGSLDFYRYNSDQLIRRLRLDWLTNLAHTIYDNVGALKGGGIEYSLSYPLMSREKMNWNIGLVGAFYAKTILDAYGFEEGEDDTYIGVIGGRCAFPVYRLQEGQSIGEIWGHTFRNNDYVAANGQWNFIDRDQNGYFGRGDYRLVGNAMPKYSIGITNHFQRGKLSLDMLLRGVFGHDMINHIKSLYSTPALMDLNNVLRDPNNELDGLYDYPDFSERDVEKASYLRLGYLTLGYNFFNEKNKLFRQFNIYVTAQNLFTITSYSGLDPELRMEDEGMRYSHTPILHRNEGNPLVHGQDRVTTYPVSRVFLFGVKIGL